ncbi:uncharacterized protein LOC121415839 isoform X1 [Lytechinus variegatus]|uniref:uncharacterized protein LOC121415839 isoform X1 n=2 Tax=Lytechinus variegatus TaxID=7654 RepID=UPI001BB13E90|nr:uncharacterized protein LOC121415839 isoform X1 [Lytechinus variegatus]
MNRRAIISRSRGSNRMRGKSVVWDHFNCEDEEGQATSPTGGKCRPAAYCSYCNLKYTFPNATKMMRHLLKCSLCPDATKRELEQSGFGEYRIDHNGSSMNNSHDDDLHAAPPSMVRPMIHPVYVENESPTPGTSALSPHTGLLVVPNPQHRNDHHEIRTGRLSGDSNRMEDQEQFSPTDRALARAIFSSDVSLDIVENVHWLELFRHLQPNYALPSKEALTGRLLDEEYMVTFDKVSTEISKAKFAAVLVQSNHVNSRVDLHAERQSRLYITTPKPLFVGCMEAEQQQNSSVIAEVISGVIAKTGPGQVLLVTTDLTKNFRGAWPIITSRFPIITTAGCPIEGLRMIPSTILAQDRILGMVKRSFKLYELWNRLVQNNETLKCIQLPYSSPDKNGTMDAREIMSALEKLRGCRDKLEECVRSKTVSTDSETKDIVLDESFWDIVNLSVQMWDIIYVCISKLEEETARLSDVVVETMRADKLLAEALGDSCLEAKEKGPILQQSYEVQRNCWTHLHYAACLVDPRYCGKCLPETATNDAIQYIVELAKNLGQDAGRILASLAEFRAKEGRLWSQEYVWEASSHVAPATWWKGICDTQPLSQIASGILSLAVTSSTTETFSYRREENLTSDQAQKFMFVRANSQVMTTPNNHPDMIMVPGGY